MPETQLRTYNGDPFKWHEWCSYFKSAIHDVSLSDAQKINYLQNALTSHKRKRFWILLFWEFYKNAITELERRFGRPQVFIAAYLNKLEHWLKPSNSKLRQLHLISANFSSRVYAGPAVIRRSHSSQRKTVSFNDNKVEQKCHP